MTLAIAVVSAGAAAAGLAGVLVPPTRRLGPRVRPYVLAARAKLGRGVEVLAVGRAAPTIGSGPLGGLVGPPVASLLTRLGQVVERRSDDALRRSLSQAGLTGVTPADFRARAAGTSLFFAGAAAAPGVLVLHSAVFTLALTACGAIYGASRGRGRVERAITARRERIRIELYTVNHLLAIHVRTGAGSMQATQRIVDRGHGPLVDDLDTVLRTVRNGTSEPEAFRRAADATPEPAAARTFKLFTTGAERGVDLADGLRAISEDLRDSRREEIRKTATKRRAAMLVPTIAILAPVMLLFIAAPLPSIVFGSR